MPTPCSANAIYSTILIGADSGTDLDAARGERKARERERNVTQAAAAVQYLLDELEASAIDPRHNRALCTSIVPRTPIAS